jgi:spore germination protein YaaH
VSSFGEVWAYVVAGRESALTKNLPVSDIGYFGAEVDSYGKLVDVPSRGKLPAFSGRVHLVAACSGRALTHFVLTPGSAERRALIADLIAAAKNFDGLQIDFENVPPRDAAAFLSFLAELKERLDGKMFTVALPARTKKISDEAYDYEKTAPLVDRILVMAYDEHWAGSKPGSIASLGWCKRVADYALDVIDREKLIMGIPFYGRAWGDAMPSQAYIYSTIERIMKENGVTEPQRENGIPFFKYVLPVTVTVYYEDAYSLAVRMNMYQDMGVASVGFWRLGQETPAVWKYILLENDQSGKD